MSLLAGRIRTVMSHRRSWMLAAVLLATLVVYLRCLGNGFVYDDDSLIVSNPYIGYWSFLWKSLYSDEYWFRNPLYLPQTDRYRPLLLIWLGLNHHLFGLRPGGWHVTMLAVHLLMVFLVFKTAARLTAERQAALLAALLFGLLPLHAEAVVWPAGFGLVLSGVFQLAAFYLVLQPAGAERRNWLLALALYPGALLSHESAASFPGLVALYVLLLESPDDSGAGESVPRRIGTGIRRAAVCLAPFCVEVLLYLVARRLALGVVFTNRTSFASQAINAQVVMTIPRVFAAYLVLLAIPWSAAPAHRVFFVRNPASPDFYVPVAALIVLAGAFFLALRNHPRRRLYLFCAAWVGIALAPMMDLYAFDKDQLVHDGYLYLASVGWCVLLADWAVWFGRSSAPARRLVCAAGLTIAVVCAVMLWNVQHFWHDDVALSTACIERFPESATCHAFAGASLEQRGDLAGAERELKKASSLKPENGATFYNLALLHARLGRTSEAAAEIGQAVRLWPNAPGSAYTLLGELYDAAGDQAQGEAVLRYAESLPGGAETAGLARARILVAHGDAVGAEKILRDLGGRYPDDPFVWDNLGLALAAQNRNQEALSAYSRALGLAPARPATHFFAAQLLHAMGRDREALEQCRQALAIQPGYAEAETLKAEITSQITQH